MRYYFFLIALLSFSAVAGRPPVAKMNVSPDTGYLPLLITFDGSQSTDPEGAIVSYEWTFGDGGTASGPTVSHLYKTNRVENARLTVTDAEGKKNSTNFILKFFKDRTPPTLSFDVPEGFQTYINTPIITAKYSDATSKVDLEKVAFYLDEIDVTAHAVIDATHGVLQFTPAWPLAPGNHTLTVRVNDYYENITTNSLHFNYVETDVTTSFLSGIVLDTDGNPAKGVTVLSVNGPGNTPLRTVTTENGQFSVPYTLGGDYKIELSKSGLLTTYKYINLTAGQGANLGTVVMAEADPKVTLVTAAAGGVATNSTSTISITVPPSSLPSDTSLSFTEAVTGKTLQVPLPNGSQFTYAFNAQPSGTVFSVASDMWIRNLLGFAPGTEVPIGTTNEALGIWADSGYRGVVSPDGTRINFKIAHFSDSDLNFPSSQQEPLNPAQENPLPEPSNSANNPAPCPCKGSPSSWISSGSNDLSYEYELPPVMRNGENIALGFNYSSTSVLPQVVIASKTKPIANGMLPTNVLVKSTFGNYVEEKEYKAEGGVNESNFFSIMSTVQPNGYGLATGTYFYEMEVSSRFDNRVYANAAYFGGPAIPGSSTSVETRDPVYLYEKTYDWVVVNNLQASRFGTGWNLTGYDRIYDDAYTQIVTLIMGNGLKTYYKPLNPGQGNPVVQKRATGEAKNLMYHEGFVYGADCSTNQVFRIDSIGRYTTLAGGSPALHTELNCPSSVFPSRKGGFYIADTGNSRILYLDKTGKVKTLASADRHQIKSPTFVTEDNVLAVHFIDGNEVRTISPYNGDVLTMIGDSEDAMFRYELNGPTQIHYDSYHNLVVLDPEKDQVIKFYIDSGIGRVILDKVGGLKEMAHDPIRKNFYFLTKSGEIHYWDGWGRSATTLLDTSGDVISVYNGKSSKKNFKRYTSLAFSPMTGLVLGSENGLTMRALDSSKSSSRQNINYVSYATDPSFLVKLDNGFYYRGFSNGDFYDFTEDGLPHRSSEKSTGHFQDFIHDSSGRLTMVEFSHGRGTYVFTYNSNGLLEKVKDPANREVHFSLTPQRFLESITDSAGFSQTFSYNPDGLMSSRRDESNRQTEYFYNAGRVSHVIKPGGRTFVIGDAILDQILNSDNQQVIPYSPLDVKYTFTGPEGRGHGYVLDSVGKTLGDIDGNGDVTWFLRDNKGRPTETTSPEGRVVSNDYYGNFTLKSTTDQNGKTNFVWDDGRISKVSDEFGNTTSFIYGTNALLSSIVDPNGNFSLIGYDESNHISELTNELSQVTRFTRDEFKNITEILDPAGLKTHFSYDVAGNLTSVTDQSGYSTQFSYDYRGRMIASTDAKNYSTHISYTPTGEVETVTDANNHTTNFEYNAFGKVLKITNPIGQHTDYDYDTDGNVLQKHTRKNEAISYAYDGNNRIIQKVFPGDSVSYAYDKDGLLTKASDSDSSASFVYDSKGRLIQEKGSHYPGILKHEYNTLGNRVGTILQLNGKAMVGIRRDYGKLREVYSTKFFANGEGGVFETSLDQAHRPNRVIYPNGIQKIINFDLSGRILSINNTSQSFNTLYSYNYNPVGSIIAITEENGGQVKADRYGYDEIQRLVAEDSAVKKWSYVLDPLGNDLSAGFSYNILNQVLESPDFTYEYDLNGNRTRKTNRFNGDRFDYTWTPENQLSSVKIYKSSQLIKTLNYTYDAIGRRIVRAVSDNVTPAKSYTRKYIYDGQAVLAIIDENNNFLSAYIHGEGVDNPIAMITDYDKNGSADILSMISDHLGSIRYLVDSSQRVVEEINYSAYGETQIKRRGNQNVSKAINGFYYTGREIEPETGEYYYRARYYDPYSAKFLSEDPLGLHGGDDNLYRYVNSAPLRVVDPEGLYFERPKSDSDWVQLYDAWTEIQRTRREWDQRQLAKSDLYFHCLINCRAAKAGQVGAELVKMLGDARELFQLPKDGILACKADLKANQAGLEAAKSNQSCEQSCYGYKQNRLIQPVVF